MAPGRAPSRVQSMSMHGSRPGVMSAPDRQTLLDACRREMAAVNLTPASDRDDLTRVVHQVLTELRLPLSGELAADLTASLAGWGALQDLLDRPDVEEVWWNDPARIYYSVAGRTRLSNVVLAAPDAQAMVARAVAACGRRLDVTQPYVDAQLADGSRLHVVIPPITREHWSVNIRRYVTRPQRLADLVAMGTMTAAAADLLEAAMRAGANVIVSGGTHTGKTTTLNTLLCAEPAIRVITVEEVRELSLPLSDWVALQTRDAGVEGTGSVVLRDLIRESLRMRPQRLVVGEVRGPEALDLLLAMNCGIPAAGTIHANSAADAIDRLTGLPLLAGTNVSAEFVARTIGSCLDVIVHMTHAAGGHRTVGQIASVQPGTRGAVVGCLFIDEGEGLIRGGAEIPRAWQFA